MSSIGLVINSVPSSSNVALNYVYESLVTILVTVGGSALELMLNINLLKFIIINYQEFQ